MTDLLRLKENIEKIKKELEEFPGVRLLAATKTVPAEVINYAVNECGIDLIGENRVQELLSKYDELTKDVELHFIGSLQRNKVKYIADKVSAIHSLDSVSLAKEIEKQCAKLGKVMDVLIEINIACEESKGGILPDELDSFYEQIKDLPHLRVAGLMTMAPAGAGEDGWRGYFTEAKALFDDFCGKNHLSADSPILSMGMSASYGAALRCGSTMIRVGSSLFGERKVK